MVGLVLNVIDPLVCFLYMVMMVEIASQRVKASCVLSGFFARTVFLSASYFPRGSFPPFSHGNP